ncbi:hypothetical protein C8R45DRAFT_1147934 [Mycena sanguinolenta]|nr:hypothetical protein C8R45DRAFT_1147934 [Mycena sanguinolenta]
MRFCGRGGPRLDWTYNASNCSPGARLLQSTQYTRYPSLASASLHLSISLTTSFSPPTPTFAHVGLGYRATARADTRVHHAHPASPVAPATLLPRQLYCLPLPLPPAFDFDPGCRGGACPLTMTAPMGELSAFSATYARAGNLVSGLRAKRTQWRRRPARRNASCTYAAFPLVDDCDAGEDDPEDEHEHEKETEIDAGWEARRTTLSSINLHVL